MPFKLRDRSSTWLKAAILTLGLAGFGTPTVLAAITIETPSPYSITGTTPRLYLAGTGLTVDTEDGFDTWPTTYNAAAKSIFQFRLRGADLTTTPVARFVRVFADVAGSSSTRVYVPLFAGTSGTVTAGNTTSGFHTALELTSNEAYVGIDFAAICSYSGTTGANIEGCTGTTVNNTNTSNGIPLYFQTFTTADAAIPANTTSAVAITVKYTSAAISAVTCPTSTFFPGDNSILVSSSKFSATPDSTTSSPTIRHLLVVAGTPTVNTAAPFSNSIRGRARWDSSDQRITGFTNVDPATVTPVYQAAFAVVDSAGAFAFTGGTCTTNNVFASNVEGFLKESNCFIATASYRDGRSPGVMLLRQFRDRILLKSTLGEKLVQIYYEKSPEAAHWLLLRPEWRVLVLKALIPVQAAVWAILHPLEYLRLLLLALLLVTFVLRSRRPRALPLILLSMVAGLSSVEIWAQESQQPYIDSLRSGIAEPADEMDPANPDPYLSREKRRLGPTQDSEGYSELLREEVAPESNSQGYSRKLQQRLPSPGSAISDFNQGKALRPNRGDQLNHGVFSIRLGMAMNRSYEAGSAEERSYADVYGEGSVPDLRFSHELHPWKGSVSNQIGILTSLGFSYVSANGRFSYVDPTFGDESKTRFRFITIPLQLGPLVRLPLGILQPFLGGGPAAIGFYERRNDGLESMRGYSFGYWGMAGIDIGLDFLSAKQSWEAYQTSGIQRTSLSIGYQLLNSFPGGLINMSSDGFLAGIAFQL